MIESKILNTTEEKEYNKTVIVNNKYFYYLQVHRYCIDT